MQPLTGLSTIIDHYDALLLDLWGVIHDGTHLYPDVTDTLGKLRQADKKIIFVSNAPRRVSRAVSVLTQLGIKPEWYDYTITSGELGYQWLSSDQATSKDNMRGKHYYYIGPAKDLDILDGLDYQRSDDIKSSDFLLNVGFGSEQQSSADWQMLLRAAKALSLPMLCLNPDSEVVKISGERFDCAGVLAAEYERLGGKVKYFGKPFAEVYVHCMEWLAPLPKSRVLAIGDGITTDIAGAVRFGIDATLVTGGILKKQTEDIEALCRQHSAVPQYIMPALIW